MCSFRYWATALVVASGYHSRANTQPTLPSNTSPGGLQTCAAILLGWLCLLSHSIRLSLFHYICTRVLMKYVVRTVNFDPSLRNTNVDYKPIHSMPRCITDIDCLRNPFLRATLRQATYDCKGISAARSFTGGADPALRGIAILRRDTRFGHNCPSYYLNIAIIPH